MKWQHVREPTLPSVGSILGYVCSLLCNHKGILAALSTAIGNNDRDIPQKASDQY